MVFFEIDAKLFKKEFNLEITFRDDKKNLDLKYELRQKEKSLEFEPVIEKNILLVTDSQMFLDENAVTRICFTIPLFVNVQKKEILLETIICSEKITPDLEKKYYFQKKDEGWIRNEEDSDIARDLLDEYELYNIAELI